MVSVTNQMYLCPIVESLEYLCDRPAHYLVRGTMVCNVHARRLILREPDREGGERDAGRAMGNGR
jgi:hypothetical protein